MTTEATGTGSVTQAAVAATPAVEATPTSQVETNVDKILAFDPFAGNGNLPDDKVEVKKTPEVEGTPSSGADGANSKPATPTKEATPSPEIVALQKQIETLQTKIAPEAEVETPVETDVGGAIPEYNFDIPDQLLAAMASEDPKDKKIGTMMLVRGVAQGIHKTIMTTMAQDVIPRVIQGAVEATRAQIAQEKQMEMMRNDFYSNHKDLDKPELKPFISQTSLMLMKEQNATAWTPEFRDALANRVRGILQSVAGGAAKQPAISTGSPTRVAAPMLDEQQKQMQDMLATL